MIKLFRIYKENTLQEIVSTHYSEFFRQIFEFYEFLTDGFKQIKVNLH